MQLAVCIIKSVGSKYVSFFTFCKYDEMINHRKQGIMMALHIWLIRSHDCWGYRNVVSLSSNTALSLIRGVQICLLVKEACFFFLSSLFFNLQKHFACVWFLEDNGLSVICNSSQQKPTKVPGCVGGVCLFICGFFP